MDGTTECEKGRERASKNKRGLGLESSCRQHVTRLRREAQTGPIDDPRMGERKQGSSGRKRRIRRWRRVNATKPVHLESRVALTETERSLHAARVSLGVCQTLYVRQLPLPALPPPQRLERAAKGKEAQKSNRNQGE